MKKILVSLLLIFCIFGMFYTVRAENTSILDEKTEGQLIKIKETSAKTLEEYKEKYGSDAYGLTAYILGIIRIYSIPFCFLGIAIGAIYQYIIGIRKLDTQEKGLALMVGFVTIFVICQVLPLIFAVVVKSWRG